jgi:hypothetical protein
MAALTREQILGAKDIQTEIVKVPEWGGEVLIGAMSGTARDTWEQSLIGAKRGEVRMENMRARLLVACAVDEKGERLFKEDDALALGRKSSVALDRCIRIIQRLNGLTDTDLEAAKGN